MGNGGPIGMHVFTCVGMYVYVLLFSQLPGKLWLLWNTVLRVLFVEMYVSVVFVNLFVQHNGFVLESGALKNNNY